MENLARDYFQVLFTRDDDIQPHIIVDHIEECIDQAANEQLSHRLLKRR
jgi:hypothetical protein